MSLSHDVDFGEDSDDHKALVSAVPLMNIRCSGDSGLFSTSPTSSIDGRRDRFLDDDDEDGDGECGLDEKWNSRRRGNSDLNESDLDTVAWTSSEDRQFNLNATLPKKISSFTPEKQENDEQDNVEADDGEGFLLDAPRDFKFGNTKTQLFGDEYSVDDELSEKVDDWEVLFGSKAASNLDLAPAENTEAVGAVSNHISDAFDDQLSSIPVVSAEKIDETVESITAAIFLRILSKEMGQIASEVSTSIFDKVTDQAEVNANEVQCDDVYDDQFETDAGDFNPNNMSTLSHEYSDSEFEKDEELDTKVICANNVEDETTDDSYDFDDFDDNVINIANASMKSNSVSLLGILPSLSSFPSFKKQAVVVQDDSDELDRMYDFDSSSTSVPLPKSIPSSTVIPLGKSKVETPVVVKCRASRPPGEPEDLPEPPSPAVTFLSEEMV